MLAKRMDTIPQACRGVLNCEVWVPDPSARLHPRVRKTYQSFLSKFFIQLFLHFFSEVKYAGRQKSKKHLPCWWLSGGGFVALCAPGLKNEPIQGFCSYPPEERKKKGTALKLIERAHACPFAAFWAPCMTMGKFKGDEKCAINLLTLQRGENTRLIPPCIVRARCADLEHQPPPKCALCAMRNAQNECKK